MRSCLIALSALALSVPAFAEPIWPSPDWAVASPGPELGSAACGEFQDFAIRSKTLKTEGLVVIKDGELQFEYYDSHFGPSQPHVLWSVSKTIVGALLGIAVRDGKLTMEQAVSEYYRGLGGVSPEYARVRIDNLFYMDSGLAWDEYYAGDVAKSPVVSMLYGSGDQDMAGFTATRPMIPEGPGFRWQYSTGTPTLLMGVLKKVYGADYERMPWTALFGPLGMSSAAFERDPAGTFIGGSYAYASPRDMAKLGYLYLNRGQWRGTTILPESWIEKTLSPSPGYLSEGTVIHDITDDGVYAGLIWLNRAVKPGFGRPYPHSPEDMFLGLGHYGQLLIVLPSQNMVIARTGFDTEYNSKVDAFVSRAIACFSDPSHEIGGIIPPPDSSKATFWKELETLETGIRDDVLQAAVAKTVCSCHFVSGVDAKTCVARSNIPAAALMALVKIGESTVDVGDEEVDGTDSWLASLLGLHHGRAARAVFDPGRPEYGCTLE